MPKPKIIVLKWFEKYFGFTRQEIIGICVLGVLLFLCWGVPRLLPQEGSDEADMAGHIREIERFLMAADEPQNTKANAAPSAVYSKQKPTPEVTYFTFDPNDLPVSDWKKLGLSEGQIRVIKNYEAKGGRFWKKEDLRKIYSISENDYVRLAPYIRVRSTPRKRTSDTVGDVMPRTVPRISIALNATDSIALQQLPGIGPVFASRIIRFRDGLGGFHHLSQLMDVYGMDTARFSGIKPYVNVDSNQVKKIALNKADYQRLRRHPFIRSKLANAIVQYRKQHGPYQSLSDLLQIAIMDEENFRKIVPYLTISDD